MLKLKIIVELIYSYPNGTYLWPSVKYPMIFEPYGRSPSSFLNKLWDIMHLLSSQYSGFFKQRL